MILKLERILIYLFLFCSLVCVYANFVQNEFLFMVFKTTAFPVIVFYYFDQSKKINYLFFISILCFYLVDLIIILKVANETLSLEIPLFISHSILLWFAIQDNTSKKFNLKITSISFFVFVITIFVLSMIVTSLSDPDTLLVFSMFFLGLLISILAALVTFNYLTDSSKKNFYFFVSCLCFIFTNAFYVIYKLIYYNAFIDSISLILKLASYFFVIKYILARESETKIELNSNI